ncbi:MAG TPA: AraC family transcriptional regulator [Oscillatoriaceae cyanobacterium]
MIDATRTRERLQWETADIRAEMAAQFAQWTSGDESKATDIPWLSLYRRTKTSAPVCYVYEPNVALILQGSKQVRMGDEVFVYDGSTFLLTAIDLPVSSCVIEASEDTPYMAMRATLDLAKIRQLILDYEIPAPKITPISRGMATGPATSELLCAFWRLLDLLEAPQDIPVMSDLILKEILYYLLKSEQGGRLWQIAMTGSQSNRIQKVINWLRKHYAEALRVDDLAQMAAMSVSSMHHHFREITSMSPLQFQKQLRLQEARRLMLVEDVDAGMAALRVGYESASQFSREYARLFGQPPMRDIKQLRASTPAKQLEFA